MPKATNNSAPINPNTGKPFAMGDEINARNRDAYNQFSGWQQQQQINTWNQTALANAASARARQQAIGDYNSRNGAGGQPAAPRPTAPRPTAPAAQAPQAQQWQQQLAQPGPLGQYATAFNSDDQAINKSNILGRLRSESRLKHDGLSRDGQRAIADQQRALAANDAAQTGRAIDAQNAQHTLKDQIAKSEIIQAGMANQAKIYGDLAQRSVSQIGLASQLQQAMLNMRNAFSQALLKPPEMPG